MISFLSILKFVTGSFTLWLDVFSNTFFLFIGVLLNAIIFFLTSFPKSILLILEKATFLFCIDFVYCNFTVFVSLIVF